MRPTKREVCFVGAASVKRNAPSRGRQTLGSRLAKMCALFSWTAGFAKKAEHYAIFENPEAHLAQHEEMASLLKSQWENHRAARNRTTPKKNDGKQQPPLQVVT